MKPDLVAEELRLRQGRASNATLHWCARAATGPSVIRVFAADTRVPLLRTLTGVPVAEIATLRTKEAFERWFETQLHKVAATIQEKNRRNSRVQPV
jgi:hypothetical protein